MTDRRSQVRRLCVYAAGALLVPFVFFLVSLRNLHDYGETSDEFFDRGIGEFYALEYPKSGFSMLNDRLDPLQQHYGPLFDTFDVVVARALQGRGLVKDAIPAHHVPIAFLSSLLLGAVFLIGTASYGPACGFASQLALLLMPQFIGHSQNNMKDQPVSFFFSLAMLGFLLAIRKGTLWRFALAGALGGLAYAVKINGVFVLPVAGLFALPFILRDLRKLPVWILRFAVATAAYVATVPLLWPLYRTNTLARFGETLAAFRQHSYNELVFYMGTHAAARDVPWHFPFVMLSINTPLVQLALGVLGLGILVRLLARKSLDEAGPLLLFAIWLFVPILVQLFSRVPRCDGVRHYLYLLPALALLAGTAAVRLWGWAERRHLGPLALRVTVFAIPVLFLTRILVTYHPYQVVYFNALAGGTAGAARSFELDYGGTSLLEASRYMDANLPRGSRVWFTQPGIHRFRVELDRISFVGREGRPNYKVSLRRGMVKTYDTDDDYLNPRRKVVFQVVVQGAPLVQILEMEENRDVAEGATLEPLAAPPAREEPGLRARVSTDHQPFRDLAPLTKLFVECPGGAYQGRTTELQAYGFLRVTAPGPHVFELSSDDGATVWLGKEALISNTTLQSSRKTVELSPGLYPIRLKYRNELGDACLAFRWQDPGGKGLVDVTVPALLHDGSLPESWQP